MNFSLHLNLGELTAALMDGGNEIVRSLTLELESLVKLEHTSGTRSGRIRKDGHQASARGEAPAVDTGYLLNSIFSDFPNKGTGIVGIGAEYAVYLESPEYLHRPFVNPAIEKLIRGQ